MKRRYCYWVGRGVPGDILTALSQETDLEWLMIDSMSSARTARRRARGVK